MILSIQAVQSMGMLDAPVDEAVVDVEKEIDDLLNVEVKEQRLSGRVSQSSLFTATRSSRATFTRGFSGAFRACTPVKTGARSMQWKHDSQTTMSNNVSSVTRIVPPSAGHGFTYVRTETKPTGQDGAVQ